MEQSFLLLVALGVGLEFLSVPFSLWESAVVAQKAAVANEQAGKANERAATLESHNLTLRSNVMALQLQLMKTGSNLVRIDPQNLPITSIRANAVIFVRGSNVWGNIDPVKDNHFVTLAIGNRERMQKEGGSFKVLLFCRYFEKYGGDDVNEWVLEFGPPVMPSPYGPAWNLTASDSVRSADEWDFFLLTATFLRDKSEILRGNLTLVMNTTVKSFPIPPQVAEMQFGTYSDMKLIRGTASNQVNVIVYPGP